MSRRRRDRQAGEAFGTSLADILTTALGCVVLLFLVAVTQIKTSLSAEKSAHASTQERLLAQKEGRQRAEVEKQVVRGQNSALEQALAAAKAQAQAVEGDRNKLATELAVVRGELDAQREALARTRERLEALEGAAREAMSALDPHSAAPVDAMLVIDGTQSMADSLETTRRNLRATVAALRVVSPTARVGVVVFRDKRERKALRLQEHPLTRDEAALEGFLTGIEATSTSRDKDRPEWLCGGLAAAEKAGWRPNALRLMIAVSDAAAQSKDARPCLAVAEHFRKAGGRLSVMSTKPVGYGTNKAVTREYDREVLPQHAAIAKAGGGTHVGQAEADALLVEVLQSAFRSRTTDPLQQLREVVDQPLTPTPPAPDHSTPPAPAPSEEPATPPAPAPADRSEDEGLMVVPRDDE
ncbi:MAG: hypothetical protein H6702_24665 [Myxococcales bacterium]|nr:hypothetical protein [Myxococcales bacterium]